MKTKVRVEVELEIAHPDGSHLTKNQVRDLVEIGLSRMEAQDEYCDVVSAKARKVELVK